MQPPTCGYKLTALRRQAMPYKLGAGSFAHEEREPVPQPFGFIVRRGALADGAALVIVLADR
jgi:hypothetical protein